MVRGSHDQESASLLGGSQEPASTADKGLKLHPGPDFSLKDPLARSFIRSGLLILTWYTLSTTLSLYNKQLLSRTGSGVFGKGAFPAPLLMCAFQFTFQHLIARSVFALKLFERTQLKAKTWQDFFKLVLPNGVTTALDIGLSNKSLAFISISFYTMCKSTVPVFLLTFAFIWRIERPSWELAGVVLVIVSGLALLVKGETDFNVTGFILVMSASATAGLRFTLTQVLLHGHQDKVALGGPLEILELLTPTMAVTTLLLSAITEDLVTLPSSPYFLTLAHTASTMGVILAGSAIAFFMVWTEYAVIKETSALTFMVAGTCKEVVTVLAAVVVMGDHLGLINSMGLGIVIVGVLLFNYHKYKKGIKPGDPASPRNVTSARSPRRDALVGRERAYDMELEPLTLDGSNSSRPSFDATTSSGLISIKVASSPSSKQREVSSGGQGIDRWQNGSNSGLASSTHSTNGGHGRVMLRDGTSAGTVADVLGGSAGQDAFETMVPIPAGVLGNLQHRPAEVPH